VLIDWKRSNGAVLLSIRDEGNGFREEQIAHLFERFYRDEHSTGLGLGLYISQQIIKAHQGTLTAENHPAGGALVEMLIPEK
jgi:two-component system phosphate regulon sensor histidine kinase PhoR